MANIVSGFVNTVVSALSSESPVKVAENLREWHRSKPLEKLTLVTNDAAARSFIDNKQLEVLYQIQYASVDGLRKLAITPQLWIWGALANLHSCRLLPQQLMPFCKTVCRAWPTIPELEFLMEYFPVDKDLLTCFSGSQIVRYLGPYLRAEDLLRLGSPPLTTSSLHHQPHQTMPSSRDHEVLFDAGLQRCQTEEDLLAAVEKSVQYRSDCALPIAFRLLQLTSSVEKTLAWVAKVLRFDWLTTARKLLDLCAEKQPLSMPQQWDWMIVVVSSYVGLLQEASTSRVRSYQSVVPIPAADLVLSAIPFNHRSTAQLLLECCGTSVDDLTKGQFEELSIKIQAWRSPDPSAVSDFRTLCAWVLRVAVWELDRRTVESVLNRARAAEEYCTVLKATCSQLQGTFSSAWWDSDIKLIRKDLEYKPLRELKLTDYWLRNFLGYWKLEEDRRRQLRELLNNQSLAQRMIKDRVITDITLKEPSTLVDRIGKKISEEIGVSATVQSALTFSSDTGLPIAKFSNGQLRCYVALYPVLCVALQTLKQAGLRFSETKPFGCLFWGGVEEKLRENGHPDKMRLDLLVKCLPLVTLQPQVVQQLEFLKLFCSPQCKPTRIFLGQYRPQLAKLPDVMRKKHPTQLWVANRLIELLEEVKPLLDPSPDIDDVLSRIPAPERIEELKKFLIHECPTLMSKIETIMNSSSDRDLVELQNVVSVVNKQRLDLKLLYSECLLPVEILRDPQRYSFLDIDKNKTVPADVIERCYRSCSIMPPDTCRRMGADHFLKMVAATRYAMSTFARLLYAQRQLILVKEENEAFANEFVISRSQIKRRASNVPIGIRELINCIRSAANIETKVTMCIHAARNRYPHLSVLSDVEYERIHRCLSRRAIDESEMRQCAQIVGLRLNWTVNLAQQLLQQARQAGVLPIEDIARPLVPLPRGHVDITASDLDQPVVFHDCSQSDFVWTLELLLTYLTQCRRLPTFSEVLIITSTLIETIREECSFLLQKASSPKEKFLFSLVIACSELESMTVVEALAPQLQGYIPQSRTKQPLHIFLTRDVSFFEAKLERSCRSLLSTTTNVVGSQSVSLASSVTPSQQAELRELLAASIPVTVFDSKEVRQGKSFAIKRRQPTAHIMALHTTDWFAALSAMKQRKPRGPYWIELGAVVTQEMVRSLLQVTVLGGLSSRSGIAIVFNENGEIRDHNADTEILLEVPHGTLDQVPGFALFPQENFPLRGPPQGSVTGAGGKVIDAVCKTEFEHCEAKCSSQLTQQATRGGWVASDALTQAIQRTAEYVCRPDVNPLIDETAWKSRAEHAPSKPSYFLTWYDDGATCKPLIISDGASQSEVAQLSGTVRVVDISNPSITQSELKTVFLEGIGVPVASMALVASELSGYVVTRHTLMAAVRISLQMRTGCCPTVMVGETGCGKTHLVNMIRKCLKMNLVTVDVNPGLVWDVDERIIARRNMGRYQSEGEATHTYDSKPLKEVLIDSILQFGNQPAILFFDELNNWAQQDIVKALMLDRSYDGVTIPQQWTVAGACNPYRVAEDGGLVYSVQPRTHPSLRAYAWTFGNCVASEEAGIVQSMSIEAKLEEAAAAFLVAAIPQAHSLMREHLPERIISFRDSRRCVRLSTEVTPVLQHLFPDFHCTPEQVSHIAFFLSYIVAIDSKKPLRGIMERHFPNAVTVFSSVATLFFEKIRSVDSTLRRNETIEETLTVVLLTVYTRTPLIIVGPPGTGKSLAPHLVTEAAAADTDSGFGKLPTLVRYNFQCTAATRPAALDEAFAAAHDIGSQVIAVMIVDELGLGDVSPARPLKVLNKWLDREGCSQETPFPSFIGTTNPYIDRSIMNRCVCLFRQLPSVETLKKMLVEVGVPMLAEKSDLIASKVYDCVSGTLVWDNRFLFGMRDFFALLRDAQRLAETSAAKNSVTPVETREIERIVLRCCGFDPIGLCGVPADMKKLRSVQLQLLRDAVETPPARPVMLRAESFASARGVLNAYLKSPPVYICGRILGMDPGMFSFHIQTVMSCMQAGQPIVMLDAPYLYEALMAVLNGSVVSSGSRKLARVAFDGESEYCVVADSFRVLLVVVEGRQVHTSVENSTAFADRFERHYIVHDKYTSVVTDWTAFKSLVPSLPEVLRGPLGNLMVKEMKSIVYGYHNSMFRFALKGSDAVSDKEVRLRCLLRLVQVPAVVQKLREQGSTVEECIAVASKIYEFRRLRPILMRERFLCSFVTAPEDELAADVNEVLAKLKQNCLGPPPPDEDSDEDDEIRKRRRRQTILEDPERVVLGPYTEHTPDGLLHLELDQTLSVENARAVVVLQVDGEKASHLLSYPLFALCELIKQLASSTTRVFLVVLCNGQSPNIQVDLHDDWRYLVLDTVQDDHYHSRGFSDMKHNVIHQVIQQLPPSETDLAKALRDVHEQQRINNNTLLELSKNFDKEARPMADEMIKSAAEEGQVGGLVHSYHQFKTAYESLVDALSWYMGIMSLHRSNLILLHSGDAPKFQPVAIDLRAALLATVLQFVRRSSEEAGPKRFMANALVEGIFFGGDVTLQNIDEIHSELTRKRQFYMRSGNTHAPRFTLPSSMHRLWLMSGSTNFPTQLVAKEPEAPLVLQVRFLHFLLQLPESAPRDQVNGYFNKPGPRELSEEARAFLMPLEENRDRWRTQKWTLPLNEGEELFAHPRWTRTMLTTFGSKVFPELCDVVGTAAKPQEWPQIVRNTTSLTFRLEYAVFIARSFSELFLTIPTAVINEDDCCRVPEVFWESLKKVATASLSSDKEELTPSQMRERHAEVKALYDRLNDTHRSGSQQPTTDRDDDGVVDAPVEWNALVEIMIEADRMQDPGTTLASLVPALYCLHEFLDGSFTAKMRSILMWSDVPRQVRDYCGSFLSFNDNDSLCSTVWPRLVEVLNNTIGVYNTLCNTFFSRLLLPLCQEEESRTSTADARQNRYFVVPPTEMIVPKEGTSSLLSLTPWSPILRWRDLVQAAWIASKGFVLTSEADTLDEDWKRINFAPMTTLSLCRDLGLGLKLYKNGLSDNVNVAVTTLPPVRITMKNLSTRSHTHLPQQLRAPCDPEILDELLRSTELRIALRRNAAMIQRSAVDMLAHTGTNRESASSFVDRPFADLRKFFENERLAAVIQQTPQSVLIKHLYAVFRAIFAADSSQH